MSPETEKRFALMTQKFESFEEKIDTLILEVKDIGNKMLCKEEAKDTYSTKLEVQGLKGKINFYAWITPLLTGLVGALLSYVLFK